MSEPGPEGGQQQGNFGRSTEEEKARQEIDRSGRDINTMLYRPLENLRSADFGDLTGIEQSRIVEALKTTVLAGPIALSRRVEDAIESFDYIKLHYTVQNDHERASAQTAMVEDLLYTTKEGPNERLLGRTLQELTRHESAVKIFRWALPYKATYFSGMKSMILLAERGEQLALSNIDVLVHGPKSKWIDKTPEGLTEDKWKESDKIFPMVEKEKDPIDANKERERTLEERYGDYYAEADFWMRAVGEMNTYNPTIKGEKLYISQTMQTFIGDLLQRMPRVLEDGTIEKIESPTCKIKVCLDASGNQIPMDPPTRSPIKQPAETNTAYVEVLDYYNKAKSEDEIRWVVSVISAMAVNNAKEIIDSLPQDITSVRPGSEENDPSSAKYNQLMRKVRADAEAAMEHYNILPKQFFDLKLARSALYLGDAVSFAAFDVAERGWANEWKAVLVDKNGNNLKLAPGQEVINGKDLIPIVVDKDKNPIAKPSFVDKDGKILNNIGWYYAWSVESSQGDPTASGDAFTAALPYVHELIYQAIKNRISANNNGLQMAVNEKQAQELLQVYLHKAEEVNNREKMIERIRRGEQKHLATFFGMLGAFKEKLGELPKWQKGANRIKELGKTVNPNLSKAIEEMVVFIPTPYHEDEKADLIYPMLAHQFKIGLFDMLTSSKDITVADLLRRTWKWVPNGEDKKKLVEASFEEGGRRLTQKDINWLQYARYADDSRAVNDNFMFQLIDPLYGPTNEETIKVAKKSPSVILTSAIKSADVGLRWVIWKFKEPFKGLIGSPEDYGKKVKRPTLEIMHAATLAFHELSLGAKGVIGYGAGERFAKFKKELTTGEITGGEASNLYIALRQIEDFITTKQGYEHYADSFYAVMLALTEALEPIVVASAKMSQDTTNRMSKEKITGYDRFKTDNPSITSS